MYSGSDAESYSYDADGNRLAETINGVSTSFGYSAAGNRLLSLGGVFSRSYDYDAQGNTTVVSGTTLYQYDPFNRLSNSGATDYVSPEGQRLRKSGGSTGTTYFAPDAGNHLLAEDDNGTWVDYVWLNGRLVGRIAGSTVARACLDRKAAPALAARRLSTDLSTITWVDRYLFARYVVSVGASLDLRSGWLKRESGANPGLPRSGKRKRTP